MTNKILLVDDEASVLSSLRRALRREPLTIVTALSAEEALDIMKNQAFKVIISDERMTGMQGSEFLAKVRNLYPATQRMALTGYASIEAAMKAVNEGEIYRFFTKPWDSDQLILAVRSAIEKFDLEAENKRLLATVEQQAIEIKGLEQHYPGISHVIKDSQGAFALQDMAEDEIENVLKECS